MSPTTLLIEDSEQNRYLATFLLEQNGYKVVSAQDGPRAIAVAETLVPDLILLDIQLPGMDGYTVARHLRQIEPLRLTPIIAVTSHAMVGDREKALAAGCNGYIEKPINPDTFIAEIASFVPHFAQPASSAMTHILIVDDKEENRYYLQALLTGNGYTVDTANHGAEALEKARQSPPDLVISDLLMPVMDGYTLLRVWKADVRLKHVPFLVYTSTYTDSEDERLALNIGADAFILKPVEPEDFLARVRDVQAGATAAVPVEPKHPVDDEDEQLKLYNTTLIRKLEERSLQLEENQDRLELATMSAGIGIWDWDVKANQLNWDSRMYELYGIREQDFSGAVDAWQAGVHPDDLARSDAAVADAIDGKKDFNIEFRVLRPDGEVRYLEGHALVQRATDGSARRMIGVNLDITERRLAEIRISYLNRVYAMLSNINALIVRVADQEHLFAEACRIAVETGGFCATVIGIYNDDAKAIVPVASAAEGAKLRAALNLPASVGEIAPSAMVEQVIREKTPVVSNYSQNDPQVLLDNEFVGCGVRSMAIFPLIVADEAVGAIVLYACEDQFFHEEELTLLTELANDIAFAIDHIEKQARLDFVAFHDVLTGLANRTLFLDRLAAYKRAAVADAHKLALFLIDLERFKNFNDSLGRAAGDALLREVAGWLSRSAGSANVLARVGADQFAMVLPVVTQESDITQFLEKVITAFHDYRFRLDDTEFQIVAKYGIAIFPDDGTKAEALFKNAEAALKNAKSSGNRYLFYTQSMNDRVAAKLELENQLRQALEKEEFVLHYQPKVDLATGKVISAEALIRWNDPRTGLVPPGQFIPVLEETGLIHDVGRWALHKAIEDHLRWRRVGLATVRVAVNVSALQLRSTSFVDEIKESIDTNPDAADGLELEITETMIMEDVQSSIASLKKIRELGVTIAIDDFGTGFSSLSYLSKLPVDTLKIDRFFVTDMMAGAEGLALVSSIISLAHGMKLKVVAEGVETEEQLSQLRLLNCDEIQGFFFSKPLPAEVFEANFLASSQNN